MKHLAIRVSGHVQGVWFRASTKAQADQLGINGMVRNEHDGTVFIEAEGEEALLDIFIAWCRQGPEQAVVEQLDIIEGNLKNYRGFHVERSK